MRLLKTKRVNNAKHIYKRTLVLEVFIRYNIDYGVKEKYGNKNVISSHFYKLSEGFTGTGVM